MAEVVTRGGTYEILKKKNAITGKMENWKLGEGGQGKVYMVQRKSDGKQFALKVYHEPTPRKYNENLQKLVNMIPPHPAFIWPLELIPPLKNGEIGYINELYDNKKLKSFKKVAISGKENFSSIEAMLNSLIELVSAFEALHAKGLCFQDINEGAIVFDVEKGGVRICDCENVVPNNEPVPIGYSKNGHELYMQGFPKYMAPEVEIKAIHPDKYTDRYSLAIMMFMVLTRCHPLEGKKRFTYNPEKIVDANVEKDIYGKNPIFIFDDNNKTNPPDPEMDKSALKAWPTIPSFVQDLFKRTFTTGVPVNGQYDDTKKRERQKRPNEKEWRLAFQKWMDLLVECPDPNCQIGYCASVDANKNVTATCPMCKKKNNTIYPIMEVYKQKVLKRTIVLTPGKIIPKSALSDSTSLEPAMVVLKAKKPGVYGVRNYTTLQWRCSCGNVVDMIVGNKDIVTLKNGARIDFDYEWRGEIKI